MFYLRRHFLIFWIIFSVFIVSKNTQAALFGQGPSKVQLTLSSGYSAYNMTGVEGASSASFAGADFDASLKFKIKSLILDIGSSYTPKINLSTVKWSDGTTGVYTLDYRRQYLGFGAAASKYFLELLVGIENITWAGTPEVDYQDTAITILGAKIGHIFKPKAQSKWSYPFAARMWFSPPHELKFNQKPNENSKVEFGLEFDFLIGVAYEI